MCKVHIALQKLHAVVLMLHKMAFWISAKVIVLHFDSSNPYACCIFNLVIMHCINLPLACLSTYLNVEADYLSQGSWFQSDTFFLNVSEAAYKLCG